MNHDHHYILNDLRKKLHDPRGPKSAVMVGAGFSRNAIPRFGGGNRFPTWKDLTSRLAEELYVELTDRQKVLEAAGATSSALRLAEEYEAAFGRAALIDLVRQETSDDDFEPSPLHEQLVDLPWADIFTTNYDRLIERAALHSPGRSLRRYSYELVMQTADIPLARRPRIVKLHGTLPELSHLVLTEEDFRCYERRKAVFVNAVRASMSENAFCLLGFSGDDPNFLAWSGWIRDTLQESSPTVYLFCTTAPAPFQRRLLEQRNVVPIVLPTVFGTKDVGHALGQLLSFLSRDPSLAFINWNRPPDSVSLKAEHGTLEREPVHASENGWVETMLIWRKNRLEYQGWEVLHRQALNWLWSNTEFAIRDLSAQLLSKHSLAERLLVTRELLWRLSVCLVPIYDEFVDEVIDPIIQDLTEDGSKVLEIASVSVGKDQVCISNEEIREAFRYVLGQLVRHAREIGDCPRFRQLVDQLQKSSGFHHEDECLIAHQSILFHLGAQETKKARQRLRNWNTDGLPAIWTIRRCGLLMEIGEIPLAQVELLKLIDSMVSARVDAVIDYRRQSIEALALFHMELVNWWLQSKRTSYQADAGLDEEQERFSISFSMTTLDDSAQSKEPRQFIGPTTADAKHIRQDDRIHESKLTRRLRELNRIGCDPKAVLNELNDLFEHHSIDTPSQVAAETDAFDIGWTTIHHRSRDRKRLRNAWRTIRFVEDAGLPTSIHSVSQLNTPAMRPFISAARIISEASASEGTGLVFRSRDEKLAKAVLDRKTLSQVSDFFVSDTLQQTKRSFDEAISFFSNTRGKRNHENQWWERQLRFSCVVFGRLVPRLSDDQLREMAHDVLLLSGDPVVWRLIGTSSELKVLLRRVAKCIPKNELLRLSPAILALPVAGDEEGNLAELPTRDWIDPISQLDSIEELQSDCDLSQAVDHIVRKISTASGEHRKNLVLRIVTLLNCDLINKETKLKFRDALFAKLDDDQFPDDTACYDSLILGLPKSGNINETELYRRAYLDESRHCDLHFWASLARSVHRERNSGVPRRSVNWTTEDLFLLVSRSSIWVRNLLAACKEEDNRHPFVRQWMGTGKRDRQQEIREWLHFVGDVVILSSKFKGKLKKATEVALKEAESAGICTVKLLPFLVAKDLCKPSDAAKRIRQAFLSDDEFVSWQACAAVVQWGRLAASEQLDWRPGLESMIGSAVLLRFDERLVLALTAARELLEVYPNLNGPGFKDDLVDGLASLLKDCDYTSDAKRTIEEKIRIRIAAVQLTQQLGKVGVEVAVLSDWMQSARVDCFSEVRHSVEQFGALAGRTEANAVRGLGATKS